MRNPSRSDDLVAINTIRFLAVDMVERAKSGHPGAPMGQAALAYWIWSRYLRHNPANPEWWNRDRFVLSCGHASALLYSLLHLAGFDLPKSELESFRQLGSKTPGHPEHGLTPGVETTTGPLGQGISNAVGMAIAERHLAARYNRPEHQLTDHRIWVLASDGDLMEGVASEASSMAGHLALGNLLVFYDANEITIDGSTDLSFTEDVPARYRAYGWRTLAIEDGNDLDEIDAVIREALDGGSDQPTLVKVQTHIGFGSPNKQDSSASHGSPLGPDEVRLTKEALGWPTEPTFLIPPEARRAFEPARQRGEELEREWSALADSYQRRHPRSWAELERARSGALPAGWHDALPHFASDQGPMATRSASGKTLESIFRLIPELLGGSADLAGSNNTTLPETDFFSATCREGRNFHFGVREHGMGAVMNGMALSGALKPYGATFLVFSDYNRPTLRLAALMGLQSIFIFTHDSIFLGEDGPTHQPISQLVSLRAIPGLNVIRPADANETAVAWQVVLESTDRPSALVLTRQKLPILDLPIENIRAGLPRGGYVAAGEELENPDAILMASGSEVALAIEAHHALANDGISTRVVSMPSWNLFDAQSRDYRDRVIPPAIGARLAIEAGSAIGWHRYVGDRGAVQAIDGFGESAPLADLQRHFGFVVEETVDRVKALLRSEHSA